jgi:class 3 adenylate cyclase
MASPRRDIPSHESNLRASDADRERVVESLREHYGAGRLSEEELSERVEAAYGVRTMSELQALTADLPSHPTPGVGHRRSALEASVRTHLAIYVVVNVMLVGIWAASGGGYFWPIWPILGWGIGVGCHAAPLLRTQPNRRGTAARERTHRRRRDRRRTSSVDDVALSVATERPSLRSAAAPDGTVTILFSDIEGSSALNERLGDVRWLELLRMHHAIVRREVRQHGGFEVKAQGDGFMIALPSARRAAHCALAIQRAIQSELGNHPEGPIRVRIGMHSGEAMRDDDDDFYGRNVSLAARIAEQARADEVLASAVVKQLAESAGDICFTEERVVELKGLGEQAVYTVVAR